MFPGYLALILVGFLLIKNFGFPAGSLGGVRAIFFAINAATCTGFDQNPGVGGLNWTGQFIVLLLIIAGSLFSMIVGSLAVRRICRMGFSDEHIIFGAVVAEILAVAVGSLPLMEGDRTPMQAMILAASAFGNCGIYVGNLPNGSSLLTHLVILPLGIVGGIGLPVLLEIFFLAVRRRSLSEHSRTCISTTIWVYIVGLSALFVLNWATRGPWDGPGAAQAFRDSSILSIESRTGGLPIYPIRLATQSALWIVVLLMMIGASPAGTGGGLKTTTIAELIRGTRNLLAGESVPRSFAVAWCWLGIYLGIVLVAAMLFCYVNPGPSFGSSLLNAVSAASNVGYSIAPLPDAKNVMYAHSAIMLIGRVTPLMILWWMAEKPGDGQIAVG
jgi:trk system potassium uptake protein TrkH